MIAPPLGSRRLWSGVGPSTSLPQTGIAHPHCSVQSRRTVCAVQSCSIVPPSFLTPLRAVSPAARLWPLHAPQKPFPKVASALLATIKEWISQLHLAGLPGAFGHHLLLAPLTPLPSFSLIVPSLLHLPQGASSSLTLKSALPMAPSQALLSFQTCFPHPRGRGPPLPNITLFPAQTSLPVALASPTAETPPPGSSQTLGCSSSLCPLCGTAEAPPSAFRHSLTS